MSRTRHDASPAAATIRHEPRPPARPDPSAEEAANQRHDCDECQKQGKTSQVSRKKATAAEWVPLETDDGEGQPVGGRRLDDQHDHADGARHHGSGSVGRRSASVVISSRESGGRRSARRRARRTSAASRDGARRGPARLAQAARCIETLFCRPEARPARIRIAGVGSIARCRASPSARSGGGTRRRLREQQSSRGSGGSCVSVVAQSGHAAVSEAVSVMSQYRWRSGASW